MSGIQYLMGVKFDDFVVIAADSASFQFGALCVSHDDDKSFKLGDKLMMAAIGEAGDVNQLGEYIEKNCHLYYYRHGYAMPPRQAAHFARKAIADGLRSQPYMVDLVMGGVDQTTQKTYLCMVDYLGNRIENSPYYFRGFSGKFCYSILDRLYKKTMTEAEALNIVKLCLAESQKRFVANIRHYYVWVINKEGIRRLSSDDL